MLETRGLTASYGQFKALFGIDLTVAPGECVAIIGANALALGVGRFNLLAVLAVSLPISLAFAWRELKR